MPTPVWADDATQSYTPIVILRLIPGNLMQAHQGFLRAFNSVTNSTAHKNNVLKAWKDMSNVPPEKVTRYKVVHA